MQGAAFYKYVCRNEKSGADVLSVRKRSVFMDEETKVTESAEKAENAEKSAEKKYSEEEMNGIVTRKSEKAVQKALKELGITDREKAKEVLKNAEKSGGQPTVQKNEGSTDELQKNLEERCRVLKNEAVDARIENAVLSAGVNSEKVKYAVGIREPYRGRPYCS